MKYLFLIIITLLLLACTKHESQASSPVVLEDLLKKRDHYVNTIDFEKAFESKPGDVCTFKSLYDAFGKRTDLSGLEWADGEWHRNTYRVYFGDDSPSNKSRSEISFECFLGLAHAFISRKDKESYQDVREIITYGYEHSWRMGDGPREYTDMKVYSRFFFTLQSYLKNLPVKGDLPVIDDYRSHVVAMYLYAMGRMNGHLNDAELLALKVLRDGNVDNPMFAALYNRFTDGEQQDVYDMLGDTSKYPDEFPYGDMDAYHWGSCPMGLHYIITVAILEGK